MKKHFLLLALTALSSLGAWAVDASWGYQTSNALPAQSSSVVNGMTLVSSCDVDNGAWIGGINAAPGVLKINTTGATISAGTMVITNVTLSYCYGDGAALTAYVQFYDAVNAALGDPQTITGHGKDNARYDDTFTAPEGAKSFKIYTASDHWASWLYYIQVTAEEQSTPQPETKTAEWKCDGTGTSQMPLNGSSSTIEDITLGTNFTSYATLWYDHNKWLQFQPTASSSVVIGTNSAANLTLTQLDLVVDWNGVYDGSADGAAWYDIQFSTESSFNESAIISGTYSLRKNGGKELSLEAPTGAKSAKIVRKGDPNYYYLLLYSVKVTAESAAPAGQTHQVKYEAGGATGTVPAAKSVGENKTYKLPEPTELVYAGHMFAGWKSSADNEVYPAGTQMTMGTADVTYTAQWTLSEVVTAGWGYQKENAFPGNASSTVGNITLSADFAKGPNTGGDCLQGTTTEFYEFKQSGQGGDLHMYIATSNNTTLKSITGYLKDIWGNYGHLNIDFCSKETFDAADKGTIQLSSYIECNLDDAPIKIDAPAGAKSARIAKTGDWGWLFLMSLVVEAEQPMVGELHTASFKAGGATGTVPDPIEMVENKPYTLPEATNLSYTGYLFKGWKSEGDENIYAASTQMIMGTEDIEFTAQWEVELVDPTITFSDANYIVDETTLDLSTLFESNSTGAVTYTVKNAGTTGAAISGTTFTATAAGTAIVTASQARVEGEYNAKAVDATITVKAYATTADFLAEANSSSPTNVNTFLSQNHYTVVASVAGNPYWDAQQSNDGGLAMTGESTTSFLVKANQKVTIKVGTLNGDQNPREAILTMNGGTPIAIAEGSETSYTTEDETVFVITTYPATTASWAWNRIQKITISDMSPKTVKFNTQGGDPASISDITEESFGAGITLPDAPAKTDYIFDGWYTAATGGTLAGAAGATYYPADNCTLHAHWAEYAKSVNFVKSAEWGGYNWDTRFNDVQDSLDLYHYTMSPLGDTQWDNQGEGSDDAGLKSEYGDREFSFWVPAGKQVTIQLGTWQGGDGTAELDANGTKIADLAAKTANGPYTTTEDTKFVIKIVNPFWSLIQKIDIEDVPVSEITISELDEDNTILVANEGKTVDVQLVRSITAGMYNTLALPFAMTADQIANSDFAGSEILRLNDATFDGSTLDINFDVVDNIEAGVPYLITPAQDFTETTIPAVTIAAIEGATETVGDVEFTAILARYQITPGDNDYLYVAAGNALKPSVAGDTSKMKGMRAYFHILNQATAVAMRRGVISVGPRHTPTMLIDILDGTATQLPERFCIDGQVYIRHNGTIYNMTGARVNKLSK